MGGQPACSLAADGGQMACTVALAASNAYDYFCGLKAGAMKCWGSAGIAYLVGLTAPVVAAAPPNLARIALSNDAPADHPFCGVDVAGHGFCWGDGSIDDLGPGIRDGTISNYGKCVLAADGGLRCDQPIVTPPLPGDYARIAASEDYVFALDAAGTPLFPQTSFPAGTYKEITANDVRRVGAIRADGAVVIFEISTENDRPGPYAHLALDHLGRACALDGAGEVRCWIAQQSSSATPFASLPAGPFVQIVGGNASLCALRSSGTTACWGDQTIVVPPSW